MANYRVELSASAEKALFKIPKKMVERITFELQALSHNPRPQGCKKLVGFQDVYRIRVGDYRIVYEIHAQIILVKVLKIGHRKEVYRL